MIEDDPITLDAIMVSLRDADELERSAQALKLKLMRAAHEQGATFRQIGEAAGCSYQTVANRLHQQ
jgi:hypothetical protein